MSGLNKVALIGLGLIGSSIARAAEQALPAVMLSGFDTDAKVSRYVAA